MGSIDGKSQESAILFYLIDFAYFATLLIKMNFRYFRAINQLFNLICLHFLDSDQLLFPIGLRLC